jgi:excisionase family DNA binding protein
VARLTVREAAEYVRLAQTTLNQMRTSGRGPQFIKLGRSVRYDTRDLDKWIDAHKQNSTADRPEMRLNRRRRRTVIYNQSKGELK